jgi:hypothetical protein
MYSISEKSSLISLSVFHIGTIFSGCQWEIEEEFWNWEEDFRRQAWWIYERETATDKPNGGPDGECWLHAFY